MRHDFPAFSSSRIARSRSSSFGIATTGRNLISVKRQIPSALPSRPSASRLKDTNSRRDFSAIPEKVLTKQLATAATRKCSGVQRPGSSKNSGGALNDIQARTPSAWTTPLRPPAPNALTRYFHLHGGRLLPILARIRNSSLTRGPVRFCDLSYD